MEQMPESIERKERAGRNLHTDLEGIVRDIASIEGPGWSELQETHPFGIPAALKQLEKKKRAVVYGAGGWNRWMVSPDGSVRLSRGHVRPGFEDVVDRARELGFEITS